MATRTEDLDTNPAAWCAIEMAIIDLLARDNGQTAEAFLELPPLVGRFRYSAVLGDSEPETFRRTLDGYRQMGFTDFKIKLSGDLDRDRGKMALFQDLDGERPRIRVDANNLWERADDAIRFLQGLKCSFFAVEEPIPPNQYAELARIGDALGCQIVLDESFVRDGQFESLGRHPARWLVNLRVSKMGGLLRSLRVVNGAQNAAVGLVVGAQVGETSLLTRAALTIASAARDRVVAQEGAFGTLLLTDDICEPPLMFGKGGILDASSHPSLAQAGFGVTALSQSETGWGRFKAL
jgi:L-Ala-D/L-Glu epimerase / N-acetyl-D-glutamate racemase